MATDCIHAAARLLRSAGWSVHPPPPPPRPRELADYERSEFQEAADRYGWRGGHPAVEVLPPDVVAECKRKAAERYAAACASVREG